MKDSRTIKTKKYYNYYNMRYSLEMGIATILGIAGICMYGNKPAQAVLIVITIGFMALGLLDESRRNKIKDGK